FWSAMGTVLLTIVISPPPTSFFDLTSEKSGSTPVVSQSIMKLIVPVGASTVACALRKPWISPASSASSHAFRHAVSRSSGAASELAERLRVALDLGRRIRRVADEDLLREEDDDDRVLERLDVELAVLAAELHQVQRGEVAGGVVDRHVLRARVRRVDASRVR